MTESPHSKRRSNRSSQGIPSHLICHSKYISPEICFQDCSVHFHFLCYCLHAFKYATGVLAARRAPKELSSARLCDPPEAGLSAGDCQPLLKKPSELFTVRKVQTVDKVYFGKDSKKQFSWPFLNAKIFWISFCQKSQLGMILDTGCGLVS